MKAPLNLPDFRFVRPILTHRNPKRFCEVYEIQDAQGNSFVLKYLNRSAASNELLQQLENEKRFSFDSPSLPQIKKVVDQEEFYGLIFQKKPGVILDQFWKQTKRRHQLSELKRLCDAMINLFLELEKENILHLDLKPSNILVHQQDENLQVSLIDFGHAKYLQDPKPKQAFQLLYSAPEVILNMGELISPATDVFSLGMVFYMLLVKQLPHHHSNPSVITNLAVSMPLEKHYRLSTEQFEVLNKACSKPRFLKPPHLLTYDERLVLIREANQRRHPTCTDFLRSLKMAEPNKWYIHWLP